MARGFLSGAIWGTVLSVGGLGALSVLAPDRPVVPVAAPQDIADTPAPSTAEGMTAEQSAADMSEPATPTSETAETTGAPSEDTGDTEAEPAPVMSAQDGDNTAEIVQSETEQSEIAESETEQNETDQSEAEQTEAAAQAVRPADVAPVTADTTAPALDTPDAAGGDVPTDSVAAPVPAPETGEAVAALAAPEISTAPVAPAPPVDQGTPSGAPVPVLTAPESEAELSLSTEPAQPPAPPVPQVDTPLVPEAEAVVPDAVEPQADSVAPDAEPTDPGTEGQASATESDATAERPPVRRLLPSVPEAEPAEEGTGTAALRPAIGTPAGSLTDRNQANSSRLPSIGADADAPTTDTPAAVPDTSGLPPLQRFAASVDSDPALPKMSIVMIDDGTGPLGPDTLDGFPFPVTFALDPAQAGVAERMAAYRALGYEVATLVSLPAAAQPTDVEQILGGALAAVPEAVALIEAPGGGLQANRAVTEQASSFVADSGHGLVFLPNGLNTAQAIAQRAEVPALSILRDFDGDGQDARTKRRFLDGAAFRARQDGAVVMLGRLTPDTLSALLLWSLQDRASSVAMVPVSTLLLDQ
jgi:polysaccharide deacetylase 2 family uncharacterized protein YibQ